MDGVMSVRGSAERKRATMTLEERAARFGADFVAQVRRRTALEPRPLETLDVVDVFSITGEFLYRGTVQERDETSALVEIPSPPAPESARHRVRIEYCRHADALPPPASLSAWERARDVDSSLPPF